MNKLILAYSTYQLHFQINIHNIESFWLCRPAGNDTQFERVGRHAYAVTLQIHKPEANEIRNLTIVPPEESFLVKFLMHNIRGSENIYVLQCRVEAKILK